MDKFLRRGIDEYVLYLQAEKNLAPRTIQEYEMDLNLLKEFILNLNKNNWQQVTHRDLRYFLHHIQEIRKNSATARARKISSLKGFFGFLVEDGIINENPTKQIQKPKLEKKLPVFLTLEECQRFINIVKENSTHKERDTTIISLFMYTGIRLSELTQLNVEHFDLDNRLIRIWGKGRKERLIPILPPLQKVLLSYLEYRNRVLGEMSRSFSPMFFSRRAKSWNRINKRTVHEIFIKYSRLAKIDHRHFSAHKLRHTFATLLYSQGVDLLQIKSLLGHSNLSTTEIYTHTSTRQLLDAINKHPLKEI